MVDSLSKIIISVMTGNNGNPTYVIKNMVNSHLRLNWTARIPAHKIMYRLKKLQASGHVIDVTNDMVNRCGRTPAYRYWSLNPNKKRVLGITCGMELEK